MRGPLRVALGAAVLVFVSGQAQQQKGNAQPKAPEIKPTRPECAIFLPERDERDDLARLLRADQFLRCERDGFPKDLAPTMEVIKGSFTKAERCLRVLRPAIREKVFRNWTA